MGLGCWSRTRDRHSVRHHRSLRPRHHRRRHRHASRLGGCRWRSRRDRPHHQQPPRPPLRPHHRHAVRLLAGRCRMDDLGDVVRASDLGGARLPRRDRRRDRDHRPLHAPPRGGPGARSAGSRRTPGRRGTVGRASGDCRGVGGPCSAGLRDHAAGAGGGDVADRHRVHHRRRTPGRWDDVRADRSGVGQALRRCPPPARLHRQRRTRHRPRPRPDRRHHQERAGTGSLLPLRLQPPVHPHRHPLGPADQRR